VQWSCAVSALSGVHLPDKTTALSDGDDVTDRQPGCGRDFVSQEHGRRGLKRGAEWVWLLVMQIYSLNIKRHVS